MLLVKGICSTKVPPTVADPDLQIRGAQVIQTLRWGGGCPKRIFLALWSSDWSKGARAPQAPPLDPPLP